MQSSARLQAFVLPTEFVRPKTNWMNVLFIAFVAIIVAFAIAAAFTGCANGMTADERYRAQIALCVERATTKLESKSCRANVDFQFRIHDGGVP